METGKAATLVIAIFCLSTLFHIADCAARAEGNCDRSQCPKSGITNFYSQVNCKPIYEDGSCCPVRYDCSSLSSRDANKCHFDGDAYEISSQVPTNKTMSSCIAGCRCVGASSPGGDSNFICAHIDCAEFFGAFQSQDPSCYRQYSLDSCCSKGVHCPKSPDEDIFQCEHEGKNYKKGEKFYPKDECKKCICEEGYDGTTNAPWCKDIQCSFELLGRGYIRRGCVPVYFKDSCCPNNWHCPSETHEIIEVPNHRSAGSNSNQNGAYCTFGNKTLRIGDKLRLPSFKNTDCTCTIPPYLSCTLTPKE